MTPSPTLWPLVTALAGPPCTDRIGTRGPQTEACLQYTKHETSQHNQVGAFYRRRYGTRCRIPRLGSEGTLGLIRAARNSSSPRGIDSVRTFNWITQAAPVRRRYGQPHPSADSRTGSSKQGSMSVPSSKPNRHGARRRAAGHEARHGQAENQRDTRGKKTSPTRHGTTMTTQPSRY